MTGGLCGINGKFLAFKKEEYRTWWKWSCQDDKIGNPRDKNNKDLDKLEGMGSIIK